MTLLDTNHSKSYDLADRYRSAAPPTLLTGVQAIARLLVEQHTLDARRGLRTASIVTGYQGSPLGGVDRMLADMPDVLDRHDIHFVPGLNEELAATAMWGSQADLPLGRATHDGVVGVWYGKGPGADRATDALRHANIYGMNPHGGGLLLVGDDPASKSSTVPAVSERSLAALGIPVLFPRNAAEIITLGLHGIAMSRASGCVVALKIVADVADGSWIVDDSVSSVEPVTPLVTWDGRPFTYVQRPMAVASDRIIPAEHDLFGPRMATVEAYARANSLNVTELDSPSARLGLVAAGTTYDSVRQALLDLGLDDDALKVAGLRLMRLALLTPMEPESIRTFADGLEQIIVVEDKTAFLETHVREILYGMPDAPVVVGKKNADGTRLIPYDGELTAGRLLAPLRQVLQDWVTIDVPRPSRIDLPLLATTRAPYFCSGCPHNRSTAIPEGSMGGGGIGCHIMVTTSGREDSAVVGLTQMGGEGAQWIGQAHFTDAGHMFQNVGDGTFFHSGQLALQACVAAKVNITYKILYNDVVAMTGAQDAEGALSVERLTHKLASEGVAKIIVCADEPQRHRRTRMAKGTVLWHRDRLDEAQNVLRETPGVTVLIYDQHCAADARRQRKRGTLAPRNTRVVINEAVCEGCGDCGVKSNCLSVQPVDTEFGRKTRIDQTSCNTDYTCLDGDCPSFMTVEVDSQAKPTRHEVPPPPTSPDPTTVLAGTHDIYMAGIGGTGILTVNQVLATAALQAGFEVESLDQTGLSQKAGPVTGHLRLASGTLEPSNRLTPGGADTILAFDLLTSVTEKNLSFGDSAKTISIASTSMTPTGDMVYDPSVAYPSTSSLLDRLESASSEVHVLDALGAAEQLFGGTTTANFLLVGAAHQAGGLPIPAAAIEAAIAINGVAVSTNIAAFRWGRAAVAHPRVFAAASTSAEQDMRDDRHDDLLDGIDLPDEVRRLVQHRVGELAEFQDRATARHYVDMITEVSKVERTVTDGTSLSEAVARYLFKLTAYKDEYEVARLLTRRGVADSVRRQVPGGRRLTFKLHPPVLRAMGRKKKLGFGPRSHAMLKVLARLKFLRGTPFDPFGYAHVRRVERALLDHYESTVLGLLPTLNSSNHARAIHVCELPDMVRGYEDIKLASARDYVDALESQSVELGSLRRLVG